ncbi:MAG: hypothetical protein Alpg2KO_24240 [Alphaproteobacteria bacterium]
MQRTTGAKRQPDTARRNIEGLTFTCEIQPRRADQARACPLLRMDNRVVTFGRVKQSDDAGRNRPANQNNNA